MKLTANFDRDEFGDVPPEYEGNVARLATLLQAFRDLAGVPGIITSGYRSAEHNREVGGVTGSQHGDATAADCSFLGITDRELATRVMAAMQAGKFPTFGQFILYDYTTHVHISLPRATRNNEILYARRSPDGETTYARITQPSDVPLVSGLAKSVARGAATTVAVMILSLALSSLFGGKHG